MKNYSIYECTKFNNFKELLEKAVMREDKAAFKYRYKKEIKEVTYTEFKGEVERLGRAVCELGLDKAHVAIVGENSYRWIHIFVSLLTTKATVVPVDKELPEEQMLNVLESSDSEVVFYSEEFEGFIQSNADKLSKVNKFIKFSSWSPIEEKSGDTDGRFVELGALWEYGKNASSISYDNADVKDDDVKLLVYTSGTTGLAKGVMLTTKNICSCIDGGLSMAKLEGACLSVLPYHHTYASVCDILGGLNAHVTICINEGLRAVLTNLKEYKPNYLFLVPRYLEVFHERIWKEAERTGKDKLLKKMIKISNGLLKVGIDMRKVLFKSVTSAFGGNLEFLMCGGALLRPDLGDFFESIGIPVVIGYGITECSPLVCANRNKFYDVRTVGLPIPGLTLKIDSPNEEGIGEIVVKSPTVMKGYYKNEEATKEAIRDGWFHTGDYGCINELGQIYIKGRKKDIIVLSNGKNIYPEEIENYIATIPAISEVVVYSLENTSGDETSLCAEIYLDPDGAKKLSLEKADEKIAYVTQKVKDALSKLPSYKQIRKVVIRESEFEKTTTKKIIRGKIKKASV